MADLETDVVIFGGGPIGLSLAAELSYRNVKCILVEKKPATTEIPKVFNITVRTMEHFRRLGISDKIREKSFPPDSPMTFSIRTSVVNGRELFLKRFASWGEIAAKKPGKEWLYFQSGCSVEIPMWCPQFELEPIIKAKVDECDNVRSFWGWEVLSFSQTKEGVEAQIQKSSGDQSNQELKTIRARYMVGCDGARSSIRKELRLPVCGRFAVQHLLSVYFEAPELTEFVRDRAGLNIITNGDIFTVFVAFKPDSSKFMCQIAFTPDQLPLLDEAAKDPRPLLRKVIGKDVEMTILACNAWKANAAIAAKYREGNIFLCGDSCHMWPPAGGLGMNTGLGDAVDLAWKLAADLQKWGGPHLLDSYAIERMPVAENTLRYVSRYYGEINNYFFPKRIFGKFCLCFPLVRHWAGSVIGKAFLSTAQETTKIVLAFEYSNSHIIVHEPEDEQMNLPPEFLKAPFSPVAKPGRRLPHIELLPAYESCYDLPKLGQMFCLFVVCGEMSECATMQNEAGKRGIPLQVHILPNKPQVTLVFPKRYYLIRADTIIAWCSNFQPTEGEAKRIFDVVTGMDPPLRVRPTLVTAEALVPPVKLPLVFSTALSAMLAYQLHRYTDLPTYVPLFAAITFLAILQGYPWKQTGSIVKSVSKYTAAVINSYNSPSVALAIDPTTTNKFGPNDVLIQVRASSVNPLDVRMCQGYGASFLSKVYKSSGLAEFPHVLGRDCSGEVVAVGDSVEGVVPGDAVYAAVPVSYQGSHARYVVTDVNTVALKPRNVDFVGAASLPWVSCTVWSALVKGAGLNEGNAVGKKVLVHGGSGGVGSFAIQLLKAWGASVTTTCSTDNIEFVRQLGADVIVNYRQENFVEVLQHDYDVVLDTIGLLRHYEGPSLAVLKKFGDAKYVSLVSPSFVFQRYLGLFLGSIAYSWFYRLKILHSRLLYGRGFFYCTANPSKESLDYIRPLVEDGQLKPVISSVYSLEEVKAAYQQVADGHSRGKVIIKM